jgi:hypothetical protein
VSRRTSVSNCCHSLILATLFSRRRVYISVRLETVVEESRYSQLRAEYQAAFGEFARCVHMLQSLSAQSGVTEEQLEACRVRVEEALRAYRESRNRLAALILTGETGEGDRGTVSRAAVERLAYHLWEEAGRPAGRAQEHWYLAEQLTTRKP